MSWCHKSALAYVIKKAILPQTNGSYPKYATPEDGMIARMLNLPLNMNKLHNKKVPSQSKHIWQSTR